jgi:hypothetical protein
MQRIFTTVSKEERREMEKKQLDVIETLIIVQIHLEFSKSILAHTFPRSRAGTIQWGEKHFWNPVLN